LSSQSKKVLMICFFFPPLGGGGIQRSVKFVKYLPDYNWRPMVLSVKNWHYHAEDNSPLPANDLKIFRAPALNWDFIYEWLYKFRLDFFAHFLKKKESHWLFPDRMIGWLPHAYRIAKTIIRFHRPDLIYTSSPPNTSHVLGYLLKKKFNIPWVADFRDEWSDYQFFAWNSWQRVLQRAAEKRILHSADQVVSVTTWVINLLKSKSANSKHKFTTIPNGFDSSELNNISEVGKNRTFTIVHAGTFYGNRNVNNLASAINVLLQQGKISPDKFRIEFIGSGVDSSIFQNQRIIKQYNYLSHHECLRRIKRADATLLIQSHEGKTGIPGKTYEYLALQKPILALIPEHSLLSSFLSQFNAQWICPFENVEQLASTILKMYRQWETNQLQVKYSSSLLGQYERKQLTQKLAAIFDGLITT